MSRLEKEAAFNDRIVAAVEEATDAVVADGRATLTHEFDPGPGDYLMLKPAALGACEVMILLDWYPTVSFDNATDEMFGADEQRLTCLKEDLADVIAGRFVWGYRQSKVLWGLLGSITIQYGEFLGRRSFTRGGANPRGAVEHHTFEPY